MFARMVFGNNYSDYVAVYFVFSKAKLLPELHYLVNIISEIYYHCRHLETKTLIYFDGHLVSHLLYAYFYRYFYRYFNWYFYR